MTFLRIDHDGQISGIDTGVDEQPEWPEDFWVKLQSTNL